MTETNEKVEPKPIDLGEYKYGFSITLCKNQFATVETITISP